MITGGVQDPVHQDPVALILDVVRGHLGEEVRNIDAEVVFTGPGGRNGVLDLERMHPRLDLSVVDPEVDLPRECPALTDVVLIGDHRVDLATGGGLEGDGGSGVASSSATGGRTPLEGKIESAGGVVDGGNPIRIQTDMAPSGTGGGSGEDPTSVVSDGPRNHLSSSRESNGHLDRARLYGQERGSPLGSRHEDHPGGHSTRIRNHLVVGTRNDSIGTRGGSRGRNRRSPRPVVQSVACRTGFAGPGSVVAACRVIPIEFRGPIGDGVPEGVGESAGVGVFGAQGEDLPHLRVQWLDVNQLVGDEVRVVQANHIIHLLVERAETVLHEGLAKQLPNMFGVSFGGLQRTDSQSPTVPLLAILVGKQGPQLPVLVGILPIIHLAVGLDQIASERTRDPRSRVSLDRDFVQDIHENSSFLPGGKRTNGVWEFPRGTGSGRERLRSKYGSKVGPGKKDCFVSSPVIFLRSSDLFFASPLLA